ncbi:MAG: hypothetical protein QG619_894, partial [Pseudomonadota bacterium]|nr:hypothetical protein [Pseudomonadota bacterium]
MAISSINGQILPPVQTLAPGNRGTSGNPDDFAALRITGQAEKGAIAPPENPTAVIGADNVEKARDEQRTSQQPDASQVKSAVEKLNAFV